MASKGWSFTQSFHHDPYPAISPTRPELSQAGRFVLVAGGSDGIGLAIAKAFLQASAAHVIIIGRRQSMLDTAIAQLEPQKSGGNARATGIVCDMSDPVAAEKLWTGFRDQDIVIDVLVLNATSIAAQGPILQLGTAAVWKEYEMNARAQLDFAERFYKQPAKGTANTKYLINISSLAVHEWTAASGQPAYGLTKNAGTLIMQQIAKDTPPEKMQVVSVNPGPTFTQPAKDLGYTEDDFHWNSKDLAGQFVVWAASSEARFLHGRFVWAEWDIEELKSGDLRKKIDEDGSFLKVGVVGL